MNMNSMVSMMGGQSNVKMTAISNAMTGIQNDVDVGESGSFLNIINELVKNMSTDATDKNQSEIEQTEMYLDFMRKLQEIDVTKIDATWFQSMFAVISPLVDESLLEQSDALAVMQSLTAFKQADVTQLFTQSGNEIFDDVYDFLTSQGISSKQAGEITETLMQIDQSFAKTMTEESLRNISNGSQSGNALGIEVVKVNDSEAIVAMNQLSSIRPTVVEISEDEIQTLTKSVMTSDVDEFSEDDTEFQELKMTGTTPVFTMRADNASEVFESDALKNDVVNQVQNQLALHIKEGNEEFVMKLKPEGLGEITVKMVMQDGGKIVVNIQTQSQEVKAMLNQEMQQLKNSLLPLNTEIGEITSYVSNEGFYQQSAYQQGNSQQPQFGKSAKHGYDYVQENELKPEVQQAVSLQTNKLLRYA